MSPRSNLSYSAAVILQAVANNYRYGFDIMDITGLPSGTIYPALRRMEETGLVQSRWESEVAAREEGRPTRKYYEITSAGTDALSDALKRYRLLEQLPAKTTNSEPTPERG